MTIEERFEKLENEVRTLSEQKGRLRRLSFASIALALAALIGGTALSVRAYTAAIEPEFINTQRIFLKDTSNKTRLVLNGLNGVVYVLDANGKARVQLLQSGTLVVQDSNGVTRLFLNATDNKIIFYNASGQVVKTLP